MGLLARLWFYAPFLQQATVVYNILLIPALHSFPTASDTLLCSKEDASHSSQGLQTVTHIRAVRENRVKRAFEMQVVNYVNSQQEHKDLYCQIPGAAASETIIPLQAEQAHFLITPTSELN